MYIVTTPVRWLSYSSLIVAHITARRASLAFPDNLIYIFNPDDSVHAAFHNGMRITSPTESVLTTN